MKVKDAQFFTVVSSFLNVYLVKNRSCSSNTVKSYEDALNLLFTFLEGTKDIPRQRVSWSHFTRQNIQEFVDWLEKVRNCSRQTQLQRLAAIRSFVRYGGIVDLRVIAIQADVERIRYRKPPPALVGYLTKEELSIFLAQPNCKKRTGFRNMVFLVLMYDTAARCQEMLDLRIQDLVLHRTSPCVYFTGKGKKLLTYPRTDSQYLTDDMLPTAESLVSGLWPLLPFATGLDLSPQFGRVLNSKKVSDHHAIVPTMEFVQKGFDGLAEGEKKLLSLVCCKLLCAVAAPHVYEAVTATFTCAGKTFTAKGKTILTPGWKELDRRFKASFKTDADDTAPELARELLEITEGQTFDKVTATVTEHFTAPPKSYTEDTLLSAMERASADDLPEDAERQGLGTPATRASILEKLVQMGFVERRGKQLLPTKDGHNLACVLPEVLTSPQLTAQWETELTAIAKGQADPEGFMAGIAEMTRGLIANYSQISEDAQKLFQAERVVIGKCPRCGESVYEGKKNYYCGNRSCQFVMWKNDRFFEERGKAFTPKIAAALLKDGKAKVKGLRSMKTGKTYDGTVLLADTGGKYVNYRVEQRGKN